MESMSILSDFDLSQALGPMESNPPPVMKPPLDPTQNQRKKDTSSPDEPLLKQSLDSTVDYLMKENEKLNRDLQERTIQHNQLLLQYTQLQTIFSTTETNILEVLDTVQELHHPRRELQSLQQRYLEQAEELKLTKLKLVRSEEESRQATQDRQRLQLALRDCQKEMESSLSMLRESTSAALFHKDQQCQALREELDRIRTQEMPQWQRDLETTRLQLEQVQEQQERDRLRMDEERQEYQQDKVCPTRWERAE